MKSVRICVAAITAGVVCIAVMLGILSAAIYAENESGDSFIGLMYHQVLKDESRAGKYIITPNELESDLAYLSENGYVSVLPSQLVKIREQGGRLPEKTVVITFDDGYETGLYYVLPLLKKYGMKAVINVVGSYTDEYSRINEEGKHLSYAYLTWNEIKKLSDSGYVEIGNHTYDMHSYNGERNGCARKENESDEQYRTVLYEDVARLSDKLQKVTGKRPVAFAYPFGSLSEGSAEIIGSAGISVFMTCCEQPCSMNRNGRIVINRYNRESGRTAQQICEEFNNAF